MNEESTDQHSENTNSSKLPKLLVDNCNYEQLKKLSFHKFNELAKSSVPFVNGGSKIDDKIELNKSKSLINLASTLNDENSDLRSNVASVIEDLKKENERLQSKVESLQKAQAEQSEKSSKESDELKVTYQLQIDKISKQYESKTKELERIVVKYAMSEKQILDAQKLRDDFEKKMKDAMKDKDSLMVRVKGLSHEKQSLMSALDSKVSEVSSCQKEMDKLRKQLKEKEAQLMQFEFKLIKEQENQLENAKKLEQSVKQIEELNSELSGYRATKSSEDEMTSINKMDLENKCKEIVDLKSRNSEIKDQMASQATRIKQLELENSRFEEDKRKLTSAINELKQEFEVCNDKIEANKQLKIEFDEKVEQLEECMKELELLREENDELVTESKALAQKEGELLDFTDKLQTKTVYLQSEHNHYKARCAELESKFSVLEETISKQNDEITKLKTELSSALEVHQNELNLFAKKLAEESNTKEKLKRQKEELENENKIMKKKHVQSVKELNKELVSLRRKIEQHEQPVEQEHPRLETISLSSRTDSSNSLERASSNGLNENHSNDEVLRTPVNNQVLNFTTPNDIAQQLDKSALLNKILTLQQQLNKLRARVEFLEEHNSTLLEDIKKKTKLIQNFILKQESNCLSSNDMDRFKNQISKGSGLMASLYRNSVSDSNMTLELSLEINNKLQAVLEDTILKNITLKESIDTLGAEIEKMSKK